MSEEGAFMNMDLLATLNAAIEAKQQEVVDAKALADQLTAEKADLESQLAAKATEMENLNTEHSQAIEEKDNQISALEQEKADLVAGVNAKCEEIETLNGQLTEKQTALDGANATIAERDQAISEKEQQISDLNAQVEDLQNGAGAQPQAGAAPQDNGAGAQETVIGVGRYVYNKDLTYEENCRREEEWNKEHGM